MKNTNQMAGSYELVLSGVIFALIGVALDRWLGTQVVFFVVFTIMGFVGSGLSLYYRYRHAMDRQHDMVDRPHNATADRQRGATATPVTVRSEVAES